uniref:RRM domain-containing protein n=1 Tax=Globodera pallida TaxID=36090 RepID=A0A183CFU5_GLOPA
MKWGMICSVAGSELVPEFERFGLWMVEELEKAAVQRNFWHFFMPSAEFLLYATPGSVEEVTKCYETINRSHPDVSYVIHVLPSKGSIEHQLLKDLSHTGVLIGQGLYLSLRWNGAGFLLLRMNQWIARRLNQIMARPNESVKPSRRKKDNFQMVIANSAVNWAKNRNLTAQDLDYSVGVVLHKNGFGDGLNPNHRSPMSVDQQTKELSTQKDGVEDKREEAEVIVRGFPATFNKFQIASLFPDFRPLHVEYRAVGEAVVQFANKYHAAQVVQNYNGHLLIDGLIRKCLKLKN